MIRYCCVLPFNLSSNVIMKISYRITKYCVYKMRMFNHSLHFIETKPVLEGRGFKPNFLVKIKGWVSHSTGGVSRAKVEVDQGKTILVGGNSGLWTKATTASQSNKIFPGQSDAS